MVNLGQSLKRKRSTGSSRNTSPDSSAVAVLRMPSKKREPIQFDSDGSFVTNDKNASVNISMIAGKDGEKPFFAVNFHPSPDMEEGQNIAFTLNNLPAFSEDGTSTPDAPQALMPTDQKSCFHSASKGDMAFSVQDPNQLHKLIDDAVECGVIKNDERTCKMKDAIDISMRKMKKFKAKQKRRSITSLMSRLSAQFAKLSTRSN